MMMKKRLLLASICSALIFVGCNQTADTAPTLPSPDKGAKTATEQPKMDKDTLLTVNGMPITKPMYSLYFQDRMRNVPNAKNTPEMQMNILNELANVIIAAQDAEKKGIDKRPEIATTLKLLRAKLLTQTVIQEYAEANKPSEEQIKTLYEAEYANQTGQEYKARHILVKEEAEAKSLIEKLAGGADFAELAKSHSTGPTGKKGGDLGWFDAKQMVKPFADAVGALEKGNYSKEPVQTQFGWHVILLEDTRELAAPTLENVRGEIINKLQQKTLADYMQELRSSSEIVFNQEMEKGQPKAKSEEKGQPKAKSEEKDQPKAESEETTQEATPESADKEDVATTEAPKEESKPASE
jgi:peptidyl-prolyl cis-trans isomerase C